MGALSMLAMLVTHPLEFRTLVQYWLYHEQNRDIAALKEHPTSGWDRASMRRCWEFLDQTSRSFSAVIKELDGDLARTICMFYLVLRGLDTIEDDMTIPDEAKQPLLRSFHINTVTPGWKFDGCGPNEKDRQLLVEYDTVIQEINLLAPEYKSVILDITEKMETGMADYTHKAATSGGSLYLLTIAEYDLYCHYVAGLVGEGLSRIWSASRKEVPWLADQLELSDSMGLLLQKTNIIRDFREDVDQERYFWPKEIWGDEKYGFKEMKEMHDPSRKQQALWAQSGMVVDALRHATDSLDYLRILKNQSVFNFCAIPATMAMATLELCFGNYTMFERNIKIRKAAAAKLIMRSTNPREVAYIFREYARKIHAKAVPTDPNFLKISVACGKIEQWCEHNYPSFVQLVQGAGGSGPRQEMNPDDARTRIVELDAKYEEQMKTEKRAGELLARGGGKPVKGQEQGSQSEVILYIGAALFIVVAVCFAVIYSVLYLTADSGVKLA